MIRLEDLLAGAAGAQARVLGEVFTREFEGFAYDSRNVRGGEMFVAVRTERADGHDFILDAVRRGATGVLCERPPAPADLATAGATCVVVDDTRRALRDWAAYVLRRQAPLVIGVTGSVGKTCTTKAVAAVLRRLGDDPRAVFDNDNFNDLFGLPISLSRLAPSHQVAVLELASDSAGEIAALCQLVAPQLGIVTNVAPAHLQHFGTLDRLAAEYGALAQAVSEHLFLNCDDPLVVAMAATAAKADARGRASGRTGTSEASGRGGKVEGHSAPVRITWFGLSAAPRDAGGEDASVRATDVWPEALGVRFRLHWQGECASVRLRLPGRHSVYTALAAASVALSQGHALGAVAQALEGLEPPPGRLRPLQGIRGSVLLDDSFSASLPSTLGALDALAACAPPRIVVLGEVSNGAAAHEPIGRAIAGSAEYLVAVGDATEPVAQAAAGHGLPAARVAVTHTVADTVARVRSVLSEHSGPATVLVKGAEGARLERVVERLLARPETAPAVLVRQAPGARQVIPLHQDRAAWMEVDLGAIAANLCRLQEIAAPAEVMAVLKADAYGHGAVRVARTVLQHGAAMLGTAVLSEAAQLRARGISAPVLVLGYTPAWQARDVVRLGVAVSLFSLDLAQHLSRAALALQRRPVPVHIKVDTGMHRLGLLPEEVVPFVRRVAALPGVRIEGVFTHFATADAADLSYALTQLGRFKRVLAEWQDAGLPLPRYVHAANSAATFRLPEARFNLVRAGIALYGLHPSEDAPCPSEFRPALALKTQIAQLKDLPPGEPVSYGGAWVTPRPSRIAVLPIGYADGFRRGPTTWGEVLVGGRRAPVVGRVCMDMCMIDVTDIPGVRVGDEVVLIGEQGGDRITAEEVAARLGTINYEVVSQILARVPREIVSR